MLVMDERVLGHVVDTPDGDFISFDATATPIGRHHTLAGAQARTVEASGARRSSPATFSRNLLAVGGSSLLVLLALTGMVFLR
ncbi:hypothetical protein BJP65_12650 [Microbacterium sp. BH-3-3-3]|nr:hypothetical protein BJP65_12650 [Microbacterium sp. BH-3-3-3]